MEKIQKKEYEFPHKPEWRIVLQYLVIHDEVKLFRITRKMVIVLDRMGITEIRQLIHELNPSGSTEENIQNFGPNWPKPKGSPFIAKNIFEKVFTIADQYLPDHEITNFLTLWINQENLGFLSNLLERKNVPMIDIIDAVKKFLMISNNTEILSLDEIVGLRVALISRFLSENLEYINIAKKFITIREISNILDRTSGPAHGQGTLGGKSAGLILARKILQEKRSDYPVLRRVKTPKSRFLTSDFILEFIHYNALEEFVHMKYQKPEAIEKDYPFLEYIFKNSLFPPESLPALNKIIDDMEGKPIVVRSSSLLEDSFEASFSGKYKSLFLSNWGPKEERLTALKNAIAEVYASTFGPDPIEYRRERGLLDFREEMGILIQQVVGNRIGRYYLPSFAGVAFSMNEFRWSPRIKREDGLLRLVAGLGTRAVDRTMSDFPVLIAPGQPGLRVNSSIKDVFRYSQQFVDVINLETNSFESVKFLDLLKECNYNYPGLEKIVSFNRMETLVSPISSLVDFAREELVVTFNPLIEKTSFLQDMKSIMTILEHEYKGPVDLEFAHDGKNIYLLQCRPQSHFGDEPEVRLPNNIPPQDIIFSVEDYVSNGMVTDIEYLVYVDSDSYFGLSTKEDMIEIGRTISRLNRILPQRKFVLIGPGRWGSKGDIKLGVPIIYSDINNTAMLIEVGTAKEGYTPELSFGTHFFQDLVEANIKYLPIYPNKNTTFFESQFFFKYPNKLPELLEIRTEILNTVKVISASDFKRKSKFAIYMDANVNKAICASVKEKSLN